MIKKKKRGRKVFSNDWRYVLKGKPSEIMMLLFRNWLKKEDINKILNNKTRVANNVTIVKKLSPYIEYSHFLQFRQNSSGNDIFVKKENSKQYTIENGYEFIRSGTFLRANMNIFFEYSKDEKSIIFDDREKIFLEKFLGANEVRLKYFTRKDNSLLMNCLSVLIGIIEELLFSIMISDVLHKDIKKMLIKHAKGKSIDEMEEVIDNVWEKSDKEKSKITISELERNFITSGKVDLYFLMMGYMLPMMDKKLYEKLFECTNESTQNRLMKFQIRFENEQSKSKEISFH